MPYVAKVTTTLAMTAFAANLAEEWQAAQETDPGPPIHFEFNGEDTVIAEELSATSWDSQSFRRAFQIVAHRADPHCQVEWVS